MGEHTVGRSCKDTRNSDGLPDCRGEMSLICADTTVTQNILKIPTCDRNFLLATFFQMIEIVFNFVVELANCAIACIGSKRPIHFDLCCGNINHIDQEFRRNIFQPEEHFLFICYEVIKCRKWSATLRKIFIDLHYNWRIINNCNRCGQLWKSLDNLTALGNQ